MNVVLFEDERHSANHLAGLLQKIDSKLFIKAIIPSVEEGIEWYRNNELPDLVFQDIILSDGNCFDLYKNLDIQVPIIFTTAFSEYALQSFQLNSIDYLLKPYDIEDVKKALHKFESFKEHFQLPDKHLLEQMIYDRRKGYKQRFLIKKRDQFNYVNSEDVAYFVSEDSMTFLILFNQEKYIIDYSITELFPKMSPAHFFQINRKAIINIQSIQSVSNWFSNRLKISIAPEWKEDMIVSRERVKKFKEWLDE